MAWHYIENGKIVGPVSDAVFKEQRARLDPNTMVWREGMKDWQRLESVPEEHREGPRSRRHLTAARSPKQPTVPAPVAPVAESPYGGFGSRMGALIVDKVLFAAIFGYFTGASGLMHSWGWNFQMNSSTDLWSLVEPSMSGLSLALLEFAYEVLMIAEFEATLGKMVFGLQVRHNNERLSYGRSLARAAAKKLSGYICGIGYLMVIWDKESRGLHDQICNTHVYKK